MQISTLLKLAKKKGHYLIGPEIIKSLTFKTQEDLNKANIQKSWGIEVEK